MRAVLSVAVVVSSLSTGAEVAWAQSYEACTKIEDNISRLNCYDDIARPTDVVASPGDWKTVTRLSKIDDTQNVFVSLESTNDVSSKYRSGDAGPALLTLRCVENTTSLHIRMNNHFLADSGGFGVVTYRIERDDAKKKTFKESTDNSVLGLWNGGQSIPFIKALFGRSELLMQVTPFSESPEIAEFNITGIEDAVAPIRKSCGW